MTTTKPERTWTILEVLRWTADYFSQQRIAEPCAAAEVLLAHVLGVERISLYLDFDKPLSREERTRFRGLIRRRAAGEPTQYLTGRQEFWSMPFQVDRSVLIPRVETEHLIEEAIRVFDKGHEGVFLDIGTGSGVVVASLAKEFPGARLVATDQSLEALQTARRNVERLELSGRISFAAMDLFSALRSGPHFDLIAANPPYVSTEEYFNLEKEIREFEPRAALEAGEDGLSCLRRILLEAHRFLKPGGWVLLEIGSGQEEAVRKLALEAGSYSSVDVSCDYAGLPRILRAQRG